MDDSPTKPRRLQILYDAIGGRTAGIAGAHGNWPCKRGCDDCCRRLAELPRATRLEWERLWAAVRALPPAVQRDVDERCAALLREAAAGARSLLTCPFLDRDAGACLVYQDRLAACRTYGFYAARDGGRWCQRVEAIATGPTGRDVVWGNHAAVDADLAALDGPALTLAEWFAAGATRAR
jgi:Fe-S-cluster containining protein